uniref:Uncharacterized protein n=1 Tax=Corethron hystrix TaxID=216773 RepID=A0A6U5GCA8_9STRA|mmetsp:Transcript_26377/g.60780  ORF Transcript_26377/g.60780 Transcript_26377/m.60780 type:complete len:164 (+) Transcript_26377:164-655(+)
MKLFLFLFFSVGCSAFLTSDGDFVVERRLKKDGKKSAKTSMPSDTAVPTGTMASKSKSGKTYDPSPTLEPTDTMAPKSKSGKTFEPTDTMVPTGTMPSKSFKSAKNKFQSVNNGRQRNDVPASGKALKSGKAKSGAKAAKSGAKAAKLGAKAAKAAKKAAKKL